MKMCTAAALICFLAAAAPAAQAMLPHCGPDQIEMDFRISTIANSMAIEGVGRFHFDRKVSNMVVMMFTFSFHGYRDTILSVWDMSNNFTYEVASSTGQCTKEFHQSNKSFSHRGAVRLGLGSEQLLVSVYKASADDGSSVKVVATKERCIPIQVTSQKGGVYVAMNFYNAQLGIQNPEVMKIPEECRGHSRQRRMVPVQWFQGF